MWAGIAIVVFTAAAVFDYKWLKTFAWPLYFINIGLLVLSLLIGTGVGGAARWVSDPRLPVPVQRARQDPDDRRARHLPGPARSQPRFALVDPRCRADRGAAGHAGPAPAGPRHFARVRGDPGRNAVHVRGQPEVACRPWPPWRSPPFRSSGRTCFATTRNSGCSASSTQAPTRRARDSSSSSRRVPFRRVGFFGQGLTNGAPAQLDFLPVQSTDFVFAILAHELGFVGSMVVFALFAALIWRILLSGWRSRDPFGLLLASGLASMILFQIFVNIGMVLGIMPITGIPLPFVTHGGASLVSLALGLGVLQSINVQTDARGVVAAGGSGLAAADAMRRRPCGPGSSEGRTGRDGSADAPTRPAAGPGGATAPRARPRRSDRSASGRATRGSPGRSARSHPGTSPRIARS